MATAFRGDVSVRTSAPALRVVAAAEVPSRHNRQRVVALDLFRGLMVAGMVVVNFQGNGSHVLPGLAHAPWNGFTLADIVFPGFLAAMGAAMALDTRTRPWARVVRRTVVLFALGFTINAVPNFDLAEVHTMGVLQRIALCYLLASVVLRVLPSARGRVVFCAAALLAYWAVLAAGWPVHLGGAATPHDGGLVGVVDRVVLGARHVYANGPVDPEGLLSTLPAVVSVLIGALVAPWLARVPTRATARLLVTRGLALAAAGGAWALLLPVNKRLWTSSYVAVAGGTALVLLGLCVGAVAKRPFRGTSRLRPRMVLSTIGANALVIFLVAEEAADVLSRYHVGTETFRTWAWSHEFAPWAGAMGGSLLYSLTFLSLLALMGLELERRHVHLRL